MASIALRAAISVCAALLVISSALDMVSVGSAVFLITDASYYRCRKGSAHAHPRFPWNHYNCAKNNTNATHDNKIVPMPYIVTVVVSSRIVVTCIAAIACIPAVYIGTTLTLTVPQYYAFAALLMITLVSPLFTSCIVFPIATGVYLCRESPPPEYGSWL